jgi:serine/threonine protein kinase
MHNTGVVHKDIKKDNILIIKNNFVLADFGVSEELELNSKALLKNSDTFSILTAVGGSPIYMSP